MVCSSSFEFEVTYRPVEGTKPRISVLQVTTLAETEAVVHHGAAKFQLSLTEEPTVNHAEARATSHVDPCLPDNSQQV